MRRIASLLIALFVSWNAFAADSQKPAPSSPKQSQAPYGASAENQQRANRNERGTDAAPFVIKVIPAANTQQPSANQTYNENEKPSPDWWIVIPTILLAVFTAGLFAYTAKLWSATSALARTTAENSEKDLRAYVGIDEMEEAGERGVDYYPRGKSPGTILVNPYAKNFGKTPAVKVKCAMALKYLDREPTEADFLAIKYGGPGTIGAAQKLTLRIEERPFDWDSYKVLLVNFGATHDPPKYLYAFGNVTYLDIFTKPHWTRFCLRVHYKNGETKPPAWDVCGPYNDTDDNPADNPVA